MSKMYEEKLYRYPLSNAGKVPVSAISPNLRCMIIRLALYVACTKRCLRPSCFPFHCPPPLFLSVSGDFQHNHASHCTMAANLERSNGTRSPSNQIKSWRQPCAIYAPHRSKQYLLRIRIPQFPEIFHYGCSTGGFRRKYVIWKLLL